MFEHACKLGLEGIVSKRRDLGYWARPHQAVVEDQKSKELPRPAPSPEGPQP
jgi:hypothetical protein